MISVPMFVWITIAAFFVALAAQRIADIVFSEMSWSQQNDFHDDEMQVRREEISATARSSTLPDSAIDGSSQTGTAPVTEGKSKIETVGDQIDELLKYAHDKKVELVPAQLQENDDNVALFTFDDKEHKLIDNIAEFTITEMTTKKDETIAQVKKLIDNYAAEKKPEDKKPE